MEQRLFHQILGRLGKNPQLYPFEHFILFKQAHEWSVNTMPLSDWIEDWVEGWIGLEPKRKLRNLFRIHRLKWTSDVYPLYVSWLFQTLRELDAISMDDFIKEAGPLFS